MKTGNIARQRGLRPEMRERPCFTRCANSNETGILGMPVPVFGCGCLIRG